MIPWDIINFNPQDSIEVSPEVGSEGGPVVAGDGLGAAVPGQPGPDEAITAIKRGGFRKRYTFKPMAFSI